MLTRRCAVALFWRLFFWACAVELNFKSLHATAAKNEVYLNHIKNYCTGTCIHGYYFNTTDVKCQGKVSKAFREILEYRCDLINKTDDYLLVIHKSFSDQKLYRTLHIQNARDVELKATAIADNIEFSNVTNVTAETLSTLEDVFRSLTLTNSSISDITFGNLKVLKLRNSKANAVRLPNLQEIDVINGSFVKTLEAEIREPKSTFSNSVVEEILSLEVNGTAVLNIHNMTVGIIRTMAVQENSHLTITHSEIDEIESLEILSGNATMENVTVGHIPEQSFQILGRLNVSNSEFTNVDKNGVAIKQTGLIYLDNVSINSYETSYILQGVETDPNSTLAIPLLHSAPSQAGVYFWFTVFLFPVTLLIMGAIIVFLVMKRKSSGSVSEDFKSSFNEKSFKNCSPPNLYMPASKPEEISMAVKTERTEMNQNEDKKEEVSKSSDFSPPGNNIGSSFPPPPPPAKESSGSTGQDLLLYVDADSDPPPPPPPIPELPFSAVKSALHQPSQDLTNNPKPAAPYPKKASTAGQFPQKPSLPQKPPAPNPLSVTKPLKSSPNPLDRSHPLPPPVDTLPPSSHYAGRSKPKPPPRRGSEISTPPPTSNATFDQNEPPLYEDTAAEEPLYAADDELEDY